MATRKTIKRQVGCTGVGLHSGCQVELTLKPASPGAGISFFRTDVQTEVPARLPFLTRLDHSTTLSHGAVSIGTVEHLLSALNGLQVDDVRIEIDGPEVPILDGSAAPFVILIHEAGITETHSAREYIKVLRPVEVRRGERWIRIVPAHRLEIQYSIGFDHPLLRHQAADFVITPQTFVEHIARARTFGFTREIQSLHASGLARGGTMDNAILLSDTEILTELRFPDEFVRHKILDAIGDLSLLGYPLLGRIEAWKAGHALHTALAQALWADRSAWTLVKSPSLAVVAPRLSVAESA